MKLLKFLLKVEVLFAAFIFSSVFKGIFSLSIDLTFVFMVLTFVMTVFEIMKKGKLSKPKLIIITVYVLLALFMLFSLTYTPSKIYAYDKLLKFSTTTFWTFAGTLLIVDSERKLENFLRGLMLVGTITVLFVFFDFVKNSDNVFRLGVGENSGNILGLGRLAGITALIILVRGFYEKIKPTFKIFMLIILFISLFVLMVTSARMALIAFVVSVLFLIASSVRLNLKEIKISRRIFGLIFVTPFLLIGFYFTNAYKYFDTMINRITVIFTQSGGGSSVSARTNMFSVASEMWKESPFLGKGIGSFGPIYLHQDSRSYPHNIFMEILSELGIAGFFYLQYFYY